MLTRYKIPIFATAIDITCLALFWFVNPADDLANNNFNFKHAYLIKIWEYAHMPTIGLPISSDIVSATNYNIELARGYLHLFLCFMQTFIIFYFIGLLTEKYYSARK